MKEVVLNNSFNGESDEAVFFYTPKFYCLDNMSAYRVHMWDEDFMTAEHAYQWKKFEGNSEVQKLIKDAPSSGDAKKRADAHRSEIIESFEHNKIDIMREVIRAKAEQHEKVGRVLREIGTRTIVENSPIDHFWG